MDNKKSASSELLNLCLKIESGEELTLSKALEASEHGIVLFAYPKANTPGCTKQACGFRDEYTKIKEAGFEVYGVSKDKASIQSSWKTKQNLPFSLLCEGQGILKALGCAQGNSIIRSVFIILKNKEFGLSHIKVSPADSVSEVLNFIESIDKKKGPLQQPTKPISSQTKSKKLHVSNDNGSSSISETEEKTNKEEEESQEEEKEIHQKTSKQDKITTSRTSSKSPQLQTANNRRKRNNNEIVHDEVHHNVEVRQNDPLVVSSPVAASTRKALRTLNKQNTGRVVENDENNNNNNILKGKKITKQQTSEQTINNNKTDGNISLKEKVETMPKMIASEVIINGKETRAKTKALNSKTNSKNNVAMKIESKSNNLSKKGEPSTTAEENHVNGETNKKDRRSQKKNDQPTPAKTRITSSVRIRNDQNLK